MENKHYDPRGRNLGGRYHISPHRDEIRIDFRRLPGLPGTVIGNGL
jgi:hypothetical protein